jgi:hypothetical protein
VNSHGLQLREREDRREGSLGQVAEGQPSPEEGGSGLWVEAGRDGQEALQRGLLCAGRSAGGGNVFGAGGSGEEASGKRGHERIDRTSCARMLHVAIYTIICTALKRCQMAFG